MSLDLTAESCNVAKCDAAQLVQRSTVRALHHGDDEVMRAELVTLTAALEIARDQGMWRGDIAPLIPESFKPEYKQKPVSNARRDSCPASTLARRRPWSVHRGTDAETSALCATEHSDLPSNLDTTDLRILRVITPGSSAGQMLHVLSSLERRSDRWDTDRESARASLSAAISLLLRLLGRDPDPAKSKEHVLLSVLAERRLLAGQSADLGALLEDLAQPPMERIGALDVNDFLPKSERRALAASLNTLLASPTFASWREGATLNVDEWLTPKDGRTPCVILSVAHLDDDERALVLGVLLEEVLSWVRTLRGSSRLRALLVFDEVYGYLPPHPRNPPTKRPLVALLKQARAFGVGVVVATQNPMDLDYRALSNAGLWCVGRLQTDADRERIVEGLAGAGLSGAQSAAELTHSIKRLAPRWFVMRDAHSGDGSVLLQPRWAMSFLRGPMTRTEIQLARQLAPAGTVAARERGVIDRAEVGA